MIEDKLAVFQIVSYSEDGRGKERVDFSSLSEFERNKHYEGLENKGYYVRKDTVLSMSKLFSELELKLNGNDKMILEKCFGFNIDIDKATFSHFDRSFTLN